MVRKIDIGNLIKGFQFPPVNFSIDAGKVAAYMAAVGDTNKVFTYSNYVPPMAVAALAMAAMGEQMSLPAGSIHVSQEFSFAEIIRTGDILSSQATVLRNIERSKIHMLTIGINITNRQNKTVVTGETGFILPRV